MQIKKFVIVIAFFFATQPLFAAVMNSTNYSIQSDSVNFGGGQSSSASYKQESTFGEVATGISGSTNFKIKAGYQQMQEVYLAIGSVADVTLSPSIDGNAGGTANGNTAVTVTTDNPTGYELYIKASSSPALVSGANSFADYTPAGANPDFTFSVPINTAEFAFTPEGTDISQKYHDNGAVCNAGAGDVANSCWNALSTTNDLIARRTSGNNPSGITTTIKFRAESGTANIQPAGTYTATTTVTAVAL
jgi:hypothetical protein